MNKTNILIVIDNLMAGGVVRALLNMIRNIKNDYSIDLLAFSSSGLLKNQICEGITLLQSNKYLNLLGETQKAIFKKSFLLGLLRAFLVLWSKLFTNKIPHRLLFSSYKQKKHYDVAISYIHDHDEHSLARGCNRFVIEKIDSNKKIAFVHSDFSMYGGNTSNNKKIYYSFDKIVCVSEGSKESFERCLEKKLNVEVVRNFVNYSEIISQASADPFLYPKNETSIVTVARLSKEKGLFRGLMAIKSALKKNPLSIHWYIVGDGPEYNKIFSTIKKEGLENHVTLLGASVNPYRYMKDADFLMLTSFHECAPMVFDEAYALGLTIIATKTTSTDEMILRRKIGFVFENSQHGIESALLGIANNVIKKLEYEPVLNNDSSIEQFKNAIFNW